MAPGYDPAIAAWKIIARVRRLPPLAALVVIAVFAAAPAAAQAGLARIAVPAASLSVGNADSGGVHPGAILLTPIGQCTDNVLLDGSDGARYIASAGHCVLGGPTVGSADVGEKVWAPGTGPLARNGAGARIGEFAYAILQDPKDISLIRLDPGALASGQMPVFGGPTGTFTSTGSAVQTLQFYGNGVGAGGLLPNRYAAALGTPDPDHVFAFGLVVPGDSGAAIETSDGHAVGVIVTTGIDIASLGTGGVDAGLIGITRLAPQLARASQMLGITLTLRTAPLLDGTPATVVAPSSGSPSRPSVSAPPQPVSAATPTSAPSGHPATKLHKPTKKTHRARKGHRARRSHGKHGHARRTARRH